jgi:hypothetical protein
MFAMRVKHIDSKGETAMAAIVDIQAAHDHLGHPGRGVTRQFAKHLGWDLEGDMSPCADCAVGKAKRRAVKGKEPNAKAEEVNRQVYMDCSTLVAPNGMRAAT